MSFSSKIHTIIKILVLRKYKEIASMFLKFYGIYMLGNLMTELTKLMRNVSLKLYKNEKMKKKYGIGFSKEIDEEDDEEFLKGRRDEVISRKKMEPRENHVISGDSKRYDVSYRSFVKTTFLFYKNGETFYNAPVLYRKINGYHPDSAKTCCKSSRFVIYNDSSKIFVKSGATGSLVNMGEDLYELHCDCCYFN